MPSRDVADSARSEDAADRTAGQRAARLPPEDRRAMICDAVIPLILEHGGGITSRQIADTAGIAEGTVFRAFGDKDNLIRAAVERYFDPEPFRRGLAAIDQDLPLESKLRAMIALFQDRLHGVFAMAAALGPRRDLLTMPARDHHLYADIIADVLEPDLDRLGVPAEKVGPFIRLIAFSRSLPGGQGHSEFTLDELTHLVQFGIAGAPRGESEGKQ